MVSVQRRGGLLMMSLSTGLTMKEEEELIHTLKKSQAEPKISMNVGC